MSETPGCLGSKHFDLTRSPSGDYIGPCFQCRCWRECLDKRTEE